MPSIKALNLIHGENLRLYIGPLGFASFRILFPFSASHLFPSSKPATLPFLGQSRPASTSELLQVIFPLTGMLFSEASHMDHSFRSWLQYHLLRETLSHTLVNIVTPSPYFLSSYPGPAFCLGTQHHVTYYLFKKFILLCLAPYYNVNSMRAQIFFPYFLYLHLQCFEQFLSI